MEGWANKTSDFNMGDLCSFPISNQLPTLVSVNHDHSVSTIYIYVPPLLQNFMN